MTTVNLDGTLDWMITGKALLAWTGQTLSITPSVNRNLVRIDAKLKIEG